MAIKNSLWYDLTFCKTDWNESIMNLLKMSTDKKVHIKKRIQYFAILKVSDKLEKGHLISLKELFEIYSSESNKELKFCGLETKKFKYHSATFRDLFMMYLPVIQVYRTLKNQTEAFIIKKPNGTDFAKLIESIEWPERNDLFKSSVAKKLENIVGPALNCCTEKDRHILKYILSSLTSVEFMNKTGFGGRTFQRRSVNTSITYAKETIQTFEADKNSLSTYMVHKKRTGTGQRLLGSGRKFLADVYPDLTSLMLRLFDSGGDGLQSHPRLICDTLFLHNNTWMNMPRCVTILRDVYGIDISLSTAYTYTDNYREKSKQAKRHHAGKNVNLGISLKKPTRDGNNHVSINDHYAQADINYSIEETLSNNGKVIARDDKALVHCDVEVVQRPSKSWKKIVYTDHDWEKDTKRSLQITTLQMVKVKGMSENEDIIAQFSGIPICQSRLTGGGVSIVKIHFFENSTVFRHFNELLYVMTLENQGTFFRTTDNYLIPQLLITVDGGPDERPRNKQTMFATVLLRKLLNIDKIKVISYAEGCSKRHSVERLHFAEGRSLSQGGIISSKTQHENETSEGLFCDEKFRNNMEVAREEAVSRIDKTPYASEQIAAIKPPSEVDWILKPEIISKITNFLKTDTSEYRFDNNFTIQPNGPIWHKLCKMFGITPTKSFSAISIYNEMFNPKSAWLQHYAFSCYRPDDTWVGNKISRYEIQPIIDIGKLPDHKYLPYQEAKKLVHYFIDRNMDLPKFLRVPDFYLPSKNIQSILKENPSLFTNDRDFTNLQNILGVSSNDIRSYIKKKEDKEDDSLKKKEIKKSFSNRLIGKLTVIELKRVLEEFNVSWTREQNNKADILTLVDKELKERNLDDEDLFQ